MKIIEEDRDFEDFIMQGEADIAVPFEVVKKEYDSVITVYSRFRHVAEEFSRLFEDDPFSENAKNFLFENLSEEMKNAGYEYSKKDSPMTLRFCPEPGKKLICPEIDGKIVMISSNDEFESYYNDTTRDVELDDEDDLDVCFAVVKDDLILSYAGVNDISDEGCIDINVETSVSSRRRNYATAVVVSLINYLVEKGEKVCYRCRKKNDASRRVAEKAGLVLESVSYSFVCFAFE